MEVLLLMMLMMMMLQPWLMGCLLQYNEMLYVLSKRSSHDGKRKQDVERYTALHKTQHW